MSVDNANNTRRAVNRRAVTTGLAWSVPAVAATAAAPFAAASLVKNPGINGWVLNSPSFYSSCRRALTVSSNVGGAGPDGAPYGLYLYDTDPRGKYDEAKLVYWVRGDHYNRNRITWSAGGSHSRCWRGPTVGKPQIKDDGFEYTPYTWTYTCPISPEDVSADGRLRLGHFHVVTSIFSQTDAAGRCLPLDIYTYREIRVDADGDGSQYGPELQHFERKVSFGGGSNLRAQSLKEDVDVAEGTATEGAEELEAVAGDVAS